MWEKSKKSWNGEIRLPRGACAEVIARCHVLNGSTRDICGGGGGMGTKRGQSTEESKKTRTQHVHVVVLTLTRIIKSVVTGQVPVTLELRNPKKKTQTNQ